MNADGTSQPKPAHDACVFSELVRPSTDPESYWKLKLGAAAPTPGGIGTGNEYENDPDDSPTVHDPVGAKSVAR